MDVLRMFLAALKKKEIDSGAALDDLQIQSTARNLIKQRRDSAAQFRRAGREELAAREEREITVLEPFLPPQPSAAELSAAVDSAIAAVSASSPRDMGRVMAQLKTELSGADMSELGKLVKQKLAG